MELLIQILGIDEANRRIAELKKEHPNMDEDWYVRQIMRHFIGVNVNWYNNENVDSMKSSLQEELDKLNDNFLKTITNADN